MDRDDLLTSQGMQFTKHLGRLIRELEEKRLPVTSWYGGLNRPRFEFSLAGMRLYARRLLGRTRRVGTPGCDKSWRRIVPITTGGKS